MKVVYKVNGMTCDGCAQALKRAVLRVAPAASVDVSVASGTAEVEGLDPQAVANAVRQAGFEFGGQVEP